MTEISSAHGPMIDHDVHSPAAEPVRSARHRMDGDGRPMTVDLITAGTLTGRNPGPPALSETTGVNARSARHRTPGDGRRLAVLLR